MKKIIIFLSLIFLSFTGVFIPSCFSDALYTLDWKWDIYLIDEQWRISWYKDDNVFEEIPWVRPYTTMWGLWSSEDWKQIYMPERKDLKTVIVWKADWTYKLTVAWWNYHLDIEGVETKKWQVDEIISRENSTEINFDDNKEWYYNLDMDFRRYKNWSFYFYQQKATWKTQKYIVDWEWVDNKEDNSILYIVNDDFSSSQKLLNNGVKHDEYNGISIYWIILILVVVISIIWILLYLYYKKKITKRLLLIISSFIFFVLLTLFILYINNSQNKEEKQLWLETQKCLELKEIWNEYDWHWEYDIVNGKVHMLKAADNERGYDVVITEIDPWTFKIIWSWYTRDKDNIYYFGKKVNWVDYCSFEISIFWKYSQNLFWIARDKNSIYKSWKVIVNADIETFEKVGTSYFKDKNHIYNIKWDIIIWSDTGTFTYYKKWNFFYDKNQIYYHGINIVWADYETFQDIWAWFIFKDKNNLYFKSDKIKWADPETFEKISDWYYKDKNHIYSSKWKILESINVNSYYLVIDTQVLFDENWLYLLSGKYFPWADAKSFVPMKDLYYKDNKNIYYSNKIDWEETKFEIINIKEADNESFMNVISWEKSMSFEKEGLGYAKDKNNVYYKWILIENSDPNKCLNEEECVKNYPQ